MSVVGRWWELRELRGGWGKGGVVGGERRGRGVRGLGMGRRLVWGRECGGMGVSGLGEVGLGGGEFCGGEGEWVISARVDVLDGVGEGGSGGLMEESIDLRRLY